jgi:ABC-2 type transport system ATP-binding protein
MVEIKNLRFRYGKNKLLFQDFSIDMKSGEIIGVLGKNGAGKTTLLNLIAGLLFPLQGELHVNGYLPKDRNPDFLADIHMIPEEFALPNVSITSYIKTVSPLYPAFGHDKLASILKEFELQPGDKLYYLSQGQRKKFLIAFALATNCKLLILDEPTNGLDIPSISLFRKILVSSVNEDQLVIISTHHVRDIDTVIDTVVAIDNGRLAFQEEMESISRKYLFKTVPNVENIPGVLHWEKTFSGYRIIRENKREEETTIDLELLFDAIINNKIK